MKISYLFFMITLPIKEMIKEAETEVLYNLLILLEIVEPVPFREVIIIFYYLFSNWSLLGVKNI